MIHEEICTYEVAKLAKERGFNEYVEAFYAEDCETAHSQGPEKWNEYNGIVAAPTQSLLQRWLREEKGYYVYPFFDNEELKWTYVVREKTGDMWITLIGETPYYDCFEEAMEDALKFVLENFV